MTSFRGERGTRYTVLFLLYCTNQVIMNNNIIVFAFIIILALHQKFVSKQMKVILQVPRLKKCSYVSVYPPLFIFTIFNLSRFFLCVLKCLSHVKGMHMYPSSESFTYKGSVKSARYKHKVASNQSMMVICKHVPKRKLFWKVYIIQYGSMMRSNSKSK